MRLLTTFIALPLLFSSLSAHAAWQLSSEDSSLNIVSIKQEHIAENFQITQLEGDLSDTGTLRIVLNLNSIATQIDIRDERIRQQLFETDNFASATLTAQLDDGLIQQMKAGGIAHAAVTGMMDFHGIQQPVSTQITLLSSNKQLMVSNDTPILLKAETFALKQGIQALKKLAGLNSISETTPVTFNLIFNAQ